jgi:NAD(P)-dependent dehydrogenase (short-subunit alcohol dehydrogenase family)
MTAARLADRVIVVTGGAGGIGLAIARAALAEGARVVIADPIAPPEDLAREVEWRSVDVTDHPAVSAMFTDVQRRYGSLGGLVNNAGILHSGTVESLTATEWDRVMRVNLDAVFFGVQAALPHFDDGATVVNIASTSAFLAGREQAAYEASKAGVVMLTRSLAVALAPRVRVNAVAPGLIDTPLTRRLFGSAAAFEARVREKIPLGRAGRPEEVAEAVLFLSAPESRYITGETLLVDGGWILP